MLRNPRRKAAPTAKLPVLRVPMGERAAFTWADFVKANESVFAEHLGWSVGRLLGCGFYGCVYESTDPWVAKFTRDYTEGPTWAFIADLHIDPELAHDMGGFLRVKDVARILPDVIWEEEGEAPQQLPVYGILRESATPLFDRDKHGDMYLTHRTAEELQLTPALIETAGQGMLSDDGMPMWTLVLDLLAYPSAPKNVKLRILDLSLLITALNEYRNHAEHYWRAWRFHETVKPKFEKEQYAAQMASHGARALRAARAMTERPNGSANMFGSVLGTTLHEAFKEADMLIADLHIMNVGWREHAEVDGTTLPLTVAVTDPGVALTPWKPDVRSVDLTKQALKRNGIDIDAHIAGLRRNAEYESYWCTFCGGSAHPATGSVYGERTIACRRCEQELWEWAQRHTHKRWGGRGAPSFYEAAVKK